MSAKRLLGAALLTAMLAGCSAVDSSGVPAPAQTEPLVVLAAASLVDVLPPLDPEETYSFDGSAALVDQLIAGAPADVFLSADEANMGKAVEAGVIEGDPVLFATNRLTLVVPAGNPANITGFDDSLAGTKLVICDTEVPCGAATTRAASEFRLTLEPVSLETKVTDVLGKVTSGEADAGIVYVTDANRAGASVEEFPIDTAEVATTYWAGVVLGSPRASEAQAFIAALPGNESLVAAGFGAPE